MKRQLLQILGPRRSGSTFGRSSKARSERLGMGALPEQSDPGGQSREAALHQLSGEVRRGLGNHRSASFLHPRPGLLKQPRFRPRRPEPLRSGLHGGIQHKGGATKHEGGLPSCSSRSHGVQSLQPFLSFFLQLRRRSTGQNAWPWNAEEWSMKQD